MSWYIEGKGGVGKRQTGGRGRGSAGQGQPKPKSEQVSEAIELNSKPCAVVAKERVTRTMQIKHTIFIVLNVKQ